jgi:hypothetical protein
VCVIRDVVECKVFRLQNAFEILPASSHAQILDLNLCPAT